MGLTDALVNSLRGLSGLRPVVRFCSVCLEGNVFRIGNERAADTMIEMDADIICSGRNKSQFRLQGLRISAPLLAQRRQPCQAYSRESGQPWGRSIFQHPSRLTKSLPHLPAATRWLGRLRPHQRGPFLLRLVGKPTRPGIGFMATSPPQSLSPSWLSMEVSITPTPLL